MRSLIKTKKYLSRPVISEIRRVKIKKIRKNLNCSVNEKILTDRL